MSSSNEIKGKKVKDLITKFFYRNNHLCFQILLHTDWNETVVFKEFTDYYEYKKAFNNLQQARANNLTVSIPNKDFKAPSKNINLA